MSRLRRFTSWAGRFRASDELPSEVDREAFLANWNVVLERYEASKRQRDELEREDPGSQEAKELRTSVDRIRKELDSLRRQLGSLGISLPPVADD